MLARQTQEFLGNIDAIAQFLAPRRRPQDAGEAECSLSELRALEALGRQQPITMSDLAGALKVPLSTATRTTDRLVAKGLVERQRVSEDRRVVQVGFSKKGREINEFVMQTRLAAGRRLLEALAPSERSDLLRRIDAMLKSVCR